MLGKGFKSVEEDKGPQFILLIPTEPDFFAKLGWNEKKKNKNKLKTNSKMKR